METVIMREKGQITIPRKIREKLGLEVGAELKLFSAANNDGFKVAKTGSVMELAGSLPRPEKALTIEEMNEGMIQQAAKEGMGDS